MRSGMTVCCAPVQPLDAADAHPVGAGAFDVGAHRDEAAREIDDLGLARGIDEHRLAAGQGRGHHHVLGRADRDDGEDHLGADEPVLGARLDIALVELDGGAEALRAPGCGDRPAACRWRSRRAATPAPASAARRAAPAPAPRRASCARDRRARWSRRCAARRAPAPVPALVLALGAAQGDRDAVLHQEMRHRRDVGDARHPAQHQRLVGQEAGHHQRQRRVLRAADGDSPLERNAAADADPVHDMTFAKGRPVLEDRRPALKPRPASRPAARLRRRIGAAPRLGLAPAEIGAERGGEAGLARGRGFGPARGAGRKRLRRLGHGRERAARRPERQAGVSVPGLALGLAIGSAITVEG